VAFSIRRDARSASLVCEALGKMSESGQLCTKEPQFVAPNPTLLRQF
jgi:hypothetical protein